MRYENILVDSSRKLADIIASELGTDINKFNDIFEVAMLDKYPESMRASRIIVLASKNFVPQIQERTNEIIDRLPTLKTDGVKRNLLKLFIDLQLSLSDELSGRLADLVFGWITDIEQSIAVRVYSMDILMKFALVYPEIRPELITILEDIRKENSAGLISRSNKAIKELKNGNLYK